MLPKADSPSPPYYTLLMLSASDRVATDLYRVFMLVRVPTVCCWHAGHCSPVFPPRLTSASGYGEDEDDSLLK